MIKVNGTMSADIFKRKMGHAIQLKWTLLVLKWAVFVLKLCPIFPKKQPLQIASKILT
jgi:hypothetical protein